MQTEWRAQPDVGQPCQRIQAKGGGTGHGDLAGATRRRVDVRRFQMRQKLASIGDDFWIEDEEGNRVYRVDGKALRARETFVLEDSSGREVAKIQETKLSVRDKVAIERDGQDGRHRAQGAGRHPGPLRDRHGGWVDLKAHGNIVDHEYEIERDGKHVARISKHWFRDTGQLWGGYAAR